MSNIGTNTHNAGQDTDGTRHITTETRSSYKTSELIVVVTIGVLVAAGR